VFVGFGHPEADLRHLDHPASAPVSVGATSVIHPPIVARANRRQSNAVGAQTTADPESLP